MKFVIIGGQMRSRGQNAVAAAARLSSDSPGTLLEGQIAQHVHLPYESREGSMGLDEFQSSRRPSEGGVTLPRQAESISVQ